MSPDQPFAIFVATKQATAKYVTDVHTDKFLNRATKGAYTISRKVDLVCFTVHSIQVEACAILHSTRVTPTTIKIRLRWRSDAFKFYLHNIDALVK